MAKGTEQAPETTTNSRAQASPPQTIGSGRDIGDRARLALVILATLILIMTFGHWALTVIGFLSSEAGRYDFSSYYAAALALRENLHANIYSAVTMAQAGAQAHTLVNPPLPYTYPPLLAIALSPFTLLSFRVLSRGWLMINAVIWMGVIFVFAAQLRYLLGDTLKRQPRAALATSASGAATTTTTTTTTTPARQAPQSPLLVDPTPLVALALAALICLGFAPAYQTIMTGQVNFLVLAPLVVIPALSSGRHERWVGVMVALAALLKITPILLVAYLLLRRRWEAAASALIAMAALSLLCVVIVGPGVFFAALPQALHVGTGDASLNHNEALLAPLAVALGPAGGSLAFKLGEYGVLGLLALVVGYVIWRAPSPGPASGLTVADADRFARAEMRAHDEIETLTYGMALCAMVLLSPTAWVHHYVWLLPAAVAALGLAGRRALTAVGSRERLRAWGLLALAAVATLALGWGLPYGWDTDPHPQQTAVAGITLWPGALELRPLGGLALLVALVILLNGYARQWSARMSRSPLASDRNSKAPQRSPSASAASGPAASAIAQNGQGGSASSSWSPVPASEFPRVMPHEPLE